MSSADALGHARPSIAVGHSLRWTDLLPLLAAALAVRLAAYHGLFGSDDITYLDRAIDIAEGHWSSANYNGALRYGFNIPAGLFVWAFGPSAFAANLWPLLCSLVEIGAVYAIAASMMDRRAGVFAALLLASAPLHVGVATRVHADPVVSMFITLSFTLLWFGWLRSRRGLLLAAGLSMGAIFWAKELVAVTWLAFVPMLWLFRGRWHDALVVVSGVLLMLVMHGVLMTWIAGHPLHLIYTVLGQVQSSFVDGMQGEDAAGYYLRYLFADIRHTGFIAFLAVSALWFVPGWLRARELPPTGLAYVALWFLGLFAVLSVFPVSLSPLRFVMKQSNYLTLFLGPMAVLAGLALASAPRRLGATLLGLTAVSGMVLGMLQQADYRAFTSNSKALAEWAIGKPGALVVGSVNNASLADVWIDQHQRGVSRARVVSFRELTERPADFAQTLAAAKTVYVLLDPQTVHWYSGRAKVTDRLPCWGDPVLQLEPVDLGVGNRLAGLLSSASASAAGVGLPGAAAASAGFERLAAPRAAALFVLPGRDVFCAAS